jgi:putative ABC transport system permease protein
MLKTITASFLLALQNIRSNFFHTILSLLGIVIGVAALVAILSLIDGMEQFAQDQISRTTSLKAIQMNAQTTRTVNGVVLKKDTLTPINFEDFKELKAAITLPAEGALWRSRGREMQLVGDSTLLASNTTAVSNLDTTFHIVAGSILSASDVEQKQRKAVINEALAKQLSKNRDINELIGRKLAMSGDTLTIHGIVTSARVPNADLFYPITLHSRSELIQGPPSVIFEAKEVTEVQEIKKQIEAWLQTRFQDKNDYIVSTNEFRVEQAAQAFKLFRIIMGMIVGISVLVGGIGVMNVLLISVTERTSEIGVRKAVGANRRDIILQFLCESITVSLFGSLLGLVLGILGTMTFVPIIKALTKVPFQAAYTLNTLLVISVIAVVIGILFGTYPAMRAAKLDPVEAIRRE